MSESVGQGVSKIVYGVERTLVRHTRDRLAVVVWISCFSHGEGSGVFCAHEEHMLGQ
jgi:hypothetical protein